MVASLLNFTLNVATLKSSKNCVDVYEKHKEVDGRLKTGMI